MSDITATHPGAPGAPVQFYETTEHHPENGTLLGFWIYLMSDCLIFACLFAVYGVLGRNYAAGPSGADLFDLNPSRSTPRCCCCRPSRTASR